MKTTLKTQNHKWAVVAILTAIALGLALPVIAVTSLVDANQSSSKRDEGWLAPLKKWQEQMSHSFRDAFKDLGAGRQNDTVVSADLREQDDGYTLRLSMPNRQLERVDIRLEGDQLHVLAPESENVGKYEQKITLKGIQPDAVANIDRNTTKDVIVVSIPKKHSGEAKQVTSQTEKRLTPLMPRETEVVTRMEEMRRKMDRIFDDAIEPLKPLSAYSGVFDQYRFGSTYEVDDEGDHYAVRIYLPGRNLEDVSVNLQEQTLIIDAESEDSSEQGDGVTRSAASSFRYSQSITLPGPVDAAEMKVEQSEGIVLVTIPKSR